MADHIDATLEQLTEWLHGAAARIPPAREPHRIEWQRDSLAAVFRRLEDLKLEHAMMGVEDEGAARALGAARSLRVEVRGMHDDTVSQGIDAQVSTMAARGMAADERRISHDVRAAGRTVQLRRIERLIPLLEAQQAVVRARLYRVRDERQDLRVQVRSIEVALEIGEL